MDVGAPLGAKSVHRIAAAAAALVLAVSVAACSGGGGTTKAKRPAATTSTVDDAKQYLALASPANQEAERFNDAAAGALTGTVSQAQLADEAAKFAGVLTSMNRQLAADQWPPKLAPIVQDLQRANAKVIADLQRAATLAPTDLAAWNHEVAQDEGRFTEVATRIRLELRLPPAEA